MAAERRESKACKDLFPFSLNIFFLTMLNVKKNKHFIIIMQYFSYHELFIVPITIAHIAHHHHHEIIMEIMCVYTEITLKNLAPKNCFNFFKSQILDL